MGSESTGKSPDLPSRNIGTIVPSNFARERNSKFGTVVLALWPQKAAVHLSQRIGCSERHANLLIAGKRKPNARAALAIYQEIIS